MFWKCLIRLWQLLIDGDRVCPHAFLAIMSCLLDDDDGISLRMLGVQAGIRINDAWVLRPVTTTSHNVAGKTTVLTWWLICPPSYCMGKIAAEMNAVGTTSA